MRNRKLVTLSLAATALGGAVLAAPAASASDTTVTFSVTGSGISVATAAATASLPAATSKAVGTTISGPLPKITVTDSRASSLGWSSKVSSLGFYRKADTAKTIVIQPGKARVFVPLGSGPTVLNGSVVASAGTYTTGPTGLALTSTAATLVTATSVLGSNQVEYTPNVEITIDSTVLATDYEGVIVHTAS